MGTSSEGPNETPSFLRSLVSILIKIFQPNGELHPAVLGFIVLSGYCIHRNGFRDLKINFRAFFVRRGYRILPIYFLSLIAGVLGFIIASDMNQLAASALSGTTNINPYCLVAKAFTLPAFISSFSDCAFLGNAPIGTVMVEIVLYIVYALVFWLLINRGLSWLWFVILSAIWLASLLVVVAFPNLYGWWQNSSVWSFLPYWWIGAALVSPVVSFWVRKLLMPLLTGWFLLTSVLLLGAPFGPALSEVRKLVFALLIGLVVVWLDRSSVSEKNPLAIIGRAGYSIYAIHAPVTYTLCLAGISWWLNIILNLCLGALCFWCVEVPTIKFASRKVAALLVVQQDRAPTLKHPKYPD